MIWFSIHIRLVSQQNILQSFVFDELISENETLKRSPLPSCLHGTHMHSYLDSQSLNRTSLAPSELQWSVIALVGVDLAFCHRGFINLAVRALGFRASLRSRLLSLLPA